MRRPKLQKLFSTFPDGWPGIGLILLRFAVAVSAVTRGLCSLARFHIAGGIAWTLDCLAITAALLILIGFLTPLAGIIATGGQLLLGLSSLLSADVNVTSTLSTSFDLLAIAIALILLGPGAYSLDARLFGRREIIIPEGRRPSS